MSSYSQIHIIYLELLFNNKYNKYKYYNKYNKYYNI